MRSAIRFAVVFSMAVSVSSPTSAQPVDEQNNSEVTLCNNSSDSVSAILIHQHFYNKQQKMLSGWYNVAPKECLILGNFPRGQVYVYAEAIGKPTQWRGTDAYACLAKRSTERTLYEGEACVQGEERRGFFVKPATDGKTTISLGA
ncbi:DUF1036 domain-containing protein [Tardiphaga sp. P5_C7]